MSLQLRTLVADEDKFPNPKKVRGSRYWSAVELLSSTWFLVECEDDEVGISRWVTTSFSKAARIQKSLEPARWSRIYICLYAPMSLSHKTLFEEIAEAHQSSGSGSYVFKLANGLSFAGNFEGYKNPIEAPREVKAPVMYCNKRTPF